MSVAEQFLAELRKGNVNGAIESIKEGLKESTTQSISEKRKEILVSHGFVLDEKKEKTYEEDSEDEKDEDENSDENSDEESEDE